MAAPRFSIVSAPDCLGVAQLQFVSGPRGIGAGSNALLSGADQTFSTRGALWRISVPLVQATGRRARRQRGLVTDLGDGAVAWRLTLPDRDRISLVDAGIYGTPLDWSRRVSWAGGVRWQTTPPLGPVAAASVSGASRVVLADEGWGHRLEPGDFLGFAPFYLGWHIVTRVLAPGTYAIWPELRRGIHAGMFATLRPTAAFRALPGSFGWGRDGFLQSGAALQLVEVADGDVRRHYDDTPAARSPARPRGEDVTGQPLRLWGDEHGTINLWGDEHGPVLMWGDPE